MRQETYLKLSPPRVMNGRIFVHRKNLFHINIFFFDKIISYDVLNLQEDRPFYNLNCNFCSRIQKILEMEMSEGSMVYSHGRTLFSSSSNTSSMYVAFGTVARILSSSLDFSSIWYKEATYLSWNNLLFFIKSNFIIILIIFNISGNNNNYSLLTSL